LSDAEGATADIYRIVRVRDSHFVQVRVAGEAAQEGVIVFPSEAADVRRCQEIFGDHLDHTLNGRRLVLGQLDQSLIRDRLDEAVAEERQRGAADDAVATVGEIRAGRIARRQVGVKGSARDLLLLAGRELAAGDGYLASDWLRRHPVGEDGRAALHLRTIAKHVIDGEALHRARSGVVAHPYFAGDEVAAAYRRLGMASPASGAVEKRAQLRHGLDSLEVDLAGGKGCKVGDAFCDRGQRRTKAVEVDGRVESRLRIGTRGTDECVGSAHGREHAQDQPHYSKCALTLHIPIPYLAARLLFCGIVANAIAAAPGQSAITLNGLTIQNSTGVMRLLMGARRTDSDSTRRYGFRSDSETN